MVYAHGGGGGRSGGGASCVHAFAQNSSTMVGRSVIIVLIEFVYKCECINYLSGAYER